MIKLFKKISCVAISCEWCPCNGLSLPEVQRPENYSEAGPSTPWPAHPGAKQPAPLAKPQLASW